MENFDSIMTQASPKAQFTATGQTLATAFVPVQLTACERNIHADLPDKH
jgi:hypothetical protein